MLQKDKKILICVHAQAKHVIKHGASGKKVMMLLANAVLGRSELILAYFQAENLQNVGKIYFWRKGPAEVVTWLGRGGLVFSSLWPYFINRLLLLFC